jgi:cell division protein ZapA
MSPKKDIQVLIGGKVYTLSGDESEEYMQRVALYINNKLNELYEAESAKKLNTHLMGILLALNVADDYFKSQNNTDELIALLEEKDQMIKDLKQQVVAEQVKTEQAQVQVDALREEIKELESDISKCQEELDEYIETFSQE